MVILNDWRERGLYDMIDSQTDALSKISAKT